MENQKTQYETQTVEKSLSLMASSLYKMQLGVNSIRDELRTLVDLQTEAQGKEKEPRRYDQ